MALKLGGRIAVVLGVFVLIAAMMRLPLQLPGGSRVAVARSGIRMRTPEEQAARQIESALDSAREALHILHVRDSLLSWRRNGRIPSSEGLGVWIDPALPDVVSNLVRDSIRSEWERIQPTTSDVSVIFALIARTTLVGGSGARRSFGSYKAFLLPKATDGRTCMVAAYVHHWRWLQFERGRATPWSLVPPNMREEFLSSCAFYAAFGQPGTAVDAWLSRSNLRFAAGSDWTTDRSIIPLSPSDWQERLTLSAAACTTGKTSRCAEALFDAPMSRWLWWAASRKHFDGGFATVRGWEAVFGEWDADYLSDLVRDMGRERFQQFWSSDLPLDSAFNGAFGVSMAEWTHQWAAARIDIPKPGPSVSSAAVLPWLLIAALAVSGGALYTLRRQVG